MIKKNIYIKTGTIEQAYNVARQIKEFNNLYQISEFNERLKDRNHLILLAHYKEQPIGFKIGYETQSKKYFYSWMGGVLKKYRKEGVAQLLLDKQEDWVKQHSYTCILVKTRIKHVGMINLLKKNKYIKMAKIPYEPSEETRLLYEKKLN